MPTKPEQKSEYLRFSFWTENPGRNGNSKNILVARGRLLALFLRPWSIRLDVGRREGGESPSKRSPASILENQERFRRHVDRRDGEQQLGKGAGG